LLCPGFVSRSEAYSRRDVLLFPDLRLSNHNRDRINATLVGRVALLRPPNKEQARRPNQRRNDQETQIPNGPGRAEANMMNLQNVMIYHALDDVEAARADKERADKSRGRENNGGRSARAEQLRDARDKYAVHAQMEKAVRAVFALKVGDGLRLARPLVANHMMPLQNLVKNNAVKKRRKDNAEQYTSSE